jgi:nucleotide-binding universal stress UspA family protein
MKADEEAAMSTPKAGPVIVHVDRSTTTGCITFAATEAQRRGCDLVVVTIGGQTLKAKRELDAVRATHPSLATIVDTAVYDESSASFVVTGSPHATVTAEPKSAPLMVFRPTLAPVGPVPPVVVALDLEPANSVLEFAFSEAFLRATSVRAMYIPPRLDDPVDPAVESSLREALDRWADKYPDVPVRFSVVVGIDAAVALTVASRSAQLLVMGWTDAEGPASVAQTLVRRAGCPVAIVA